MNKTIFEAHGEELIARAGMTKTEFARRMGIKKQNVKALFRSPKLDTIQRTADVLGLPFIYLIGYVNPIDMDQEPFNSFVIRPEDIPTGDSSEDRIVRQHLIMQFYEQWELEHSEQKLYNTDLDQDLDVSLISLDETATQGAVRYLSTLAVLQLDAILANAKMVKTIPARHDVSQQSSFDKMIQMSYECVGIATVKLLVGVKAVGEADGEAESSYFVTSIQPELNFPDVVEPRQQSR